MSKDSDASDHQTIAQGMVPGMNVSTKMVFRALVFFHLLMFHLYVQEFLLELLSAGLFPDLFLCAAAKIFQVPFP